MNEYENKLKELSRSFRTWCYFKELITYFLAGLFVTSFLCIVTAGIFYITRTLKILLIYVLIIVVISLICAIYGLVSYAIREHARHVVEMVEKEEKKNSSDFSSTSGS